MKKNWYVIYEINHSITFLGCYSYKANAEKRRLKEIENDTLGNHFHEYYRVVHKSQLYYLQA